MQDVEPNRTRLDDVLGATPKRKALTFPNRLCEGLDREIYLPYRYFTELEIVGALEEYPLTIQWLVVQLQFAMRMYGLKKPKYHAVWAAQQHLLKTAEEGEIDVRPSYIGTQISNSHLFRTLNKLGRCAEPEVIGGESMYPLVGFPSDYKKDFIYPEIRKAFQSPILNYIRKHKAWIFLNEKGVICFDESLLVLYPDLASEARTFQTKDGRILESPQNSKVHFAFVEV